ncbi:MAG: nitrile hydratase beta subunit [Gammaproteobacteria bacterium]|jgi:nitrile hydratase beta subunit
MDGIHDLGGMQGFGPVDIEIDEPVFHQDWERRVFALSMAAPFVVEFGDDQFRRQIEGLSPQQYLNSSYYQLWFEGMINQLKECGVISDYECVQSVGINPLPEHFDHNNQAQAEGLQETVEEGGSQAMPEANGPCRFSIGDAVLTCSHIDSVHTRLPQYARGITGRVIAERGMFTFADSNSVDYDPKPQMLYCVEFSALELWGDEAQPGDTLCLDLWDEYLEPLV